MRYRRRTNMTEQIYLDRIEKGVKILRTYDIMIHGQGNYKTMPHYMKVLGDFCIDYLKYKAASTGEVIHPIENVNTLLDICKSHNIKVVDTVVAHAKLIQDCKELKYTDVAECMKVMPETSAIITEITAELGL